MSTLDRYMYSVTISSVASSPPLPVEADEIEDIFKNDGIQFRQLRTSPISITYLTATDPSNALDPHISENLSCIQSFQVYQLDDADSTSSKSCKVYHSFLPIKIPFSSSNIVATQIQSKIPPRMRRKQERATGRTRRPAPFRNILPNWSTNSRRKEWM
ncbi:hypothetical protein E2P81_ATG03387 [Venturia nashicola]|nr:hypothetical protein E2P81_ATG03387 [Venturia nashicola]